MFRDLAHTFDAPIELVIGGAASAEMAESRMIRPDERGRADGGAAIEDAFVVLDAAGANGRVRADWVVVRAAAGDGRSFQSQVVQNAAPLSVRFDVQLEDRQLDAVVADFFELFED